MTFTTIRGTGGAADTFAGSNGVDTLAFVNQTNSFLLYGAQSNDVVTVASAYTTSISGSLNGGAGNDNYNLTGPAAATVFASGSLNGNQGDDTIAVFGSNLSTIQGGQGNDGITLTGTTSSSYVNGNKGNDTFTVGNTTNSSILGGQGVDNFTLAGVYTGSTFSGDLGADIINSTATANYSSSTIFGGDGDDVITEVAAFNAVLSADAGADVVTSAGGADSLFGGEGNDTLTAAGGQDTISGGAGSDRFAQAGNSTAAATGGTAGTAVTTTISAGETIIQAMDVITDYTTSVDQMISTGAAGATTVTLGTTAITNAAGANFLIRGNWSASNTTFTASATGADALFIRPGAVLGTGTFAASFGTQSTVIQGLGANIGNIGATVAS